MLGKGGTKGGKNAGSRDHQHLLGPPKACDACDGLASQLQHLPCQTSSSPFSLAATLMA